MKVCQMPIFQKISTGHCPDIGQLFFELSSFRESHMNQTKTYGLFSLPVLVGALGFFVDIYDLLLFNIVRRSSLSDLGVDPASLQGIGEDILSWQMIGLTIGGIIWGILGDKKGRKSVLFSSIILYSLATIANGFVTSVEQYTWIRFIAALGLAGELGASITLTSELLPSKKRGLAAAIIATSGVLGTITAYFIYSIGKDWRLCYFIGGGMGIALLFLRMGVLESGIYKHTRESNVSMGNFWMILSDGRRMLKYLRAIFIGLPVWYVIGILVSFSDKFAEQFNIKGFDQPKALMLQYVALAFGDVAAGLLSNYIKSRKKTLLVFYGIITVFIILFFALKGGGSATNLYLICLGLGFGSGLSVLYITMSAEQFGTNLRATVAISVPNLVRGCLPLMIMLFKFLRSEPVLNNFVSAAAITGAVILVIGILSALYTPETFGKDLDYIEK